MKKIDLYKNRKCVFRKCKDTDC